jgi:hypothetical protein
MKIACSLALIACTAGITGLAHSQQPAAAAEAVVASEPGKAIAVRTAELRAKVIAIDKARRAVSLKGPDRTVEVIAGDQVKNFDRIAVGDDVLVSYVESLTLELRKARAPGGGSVSGTAMRAAPGSGPAGMVGREVTLLADVMAVDPVKSIISLRGPQGNVVDLPVQNRDHFKVVKKGDQVEVVYTEAVAVAVVAAKK